ncbi:MAG: ABC transporter ATP-binding protein [Flavobacteriales bacterium]|nr:ABC transporter ATP-binding protein [Flavobacteriales bacterium]
MIEINALHKYFGKFQALSDVNLFLEKGHCYALIGPNGSGKTTLIKSILSLVIPSSGKIQIDGKVWGNNPEYRKMIGYMPQNPRFPDSMTIGQIFSMMKDVRGEYVADEELIRSYHIDQMSHKKLGTLSGGTKQKVNAALAFLFTPQILILDEPTAGLDPVSAEILKEKIQQERRRGKLILITSHILSDLDDLISDLVFMQEGKIMVQCSLDWIKQETQQHVLTKAIASWMKNQNVDR